MVRERTPEPHQPPRDAGSSLGSPDVCEGQDSVSCAAENGQQGGNMLHKPHGGYQIPITVAHCLPAVGVVPPSPGLVQCDSRSGVTDTSVLSRVDAQRDCIPGSVEDLRPVQSRSLCFQTEQPAPTLCQLETRPVRNGDGCLSVAVDRPSGICFPSLCTNWEMPAEDPPGAGNSATHSSSLAHPNMVSMASGNGGPLSDTATLLQGPPARPEHPLLVNRQLHLAAWRVSGVPTICRAFQAEFQRLCQQGGGKGQSVRLAQMGWLV